jgi:hypothetical protein
MKGTMSKPPIVTPPQIPESQPFKRFEWLAKRLMAVPKKELDEKVAEYEHDKERRKRKKKT